MFSNLKMNASVFLIFGCVFFSACTQEVEEPSNNVNLPPDLAPDAVNIDHAEDGELNGPYWQNLVFSRSQANEKWTESVTIIEHASGPDATILEQDIGDYEAGDLLIVLTYFPENKVGAGELSFIHSKDEGETWSDPVALSLEGTDGHIPVDPSILQAEDGSLILVYQDLRESNDQSDEHNFYLALSEDGENFTFEAEIFSSPDFLIHADLIYFDDFWYLFIATDEGDRMMRISKSDDYLSFSEEHITDMPGIPGSMVMGDQLFVYGSDLSGTTINSSDDGISFEQVDHIQIGTSAPSPVLFEDGSIGVVGTFHAEH